MGRSVVSSHRTQYKYIYSLDYIMQHSLYLYPHKKENLPISIKFEGDELLETEYFYKKEFISVKNLENTTYQN